MLTDIQSREDIYKLVTTFYGKVQLDDLIGPVFNRMIAADQWPRHFEHLTDFWETNLFAVPVFKGNPVAVHRKVDAAHGHSISPDHFGQWLNLWFQTVDSLYAGELAEKAKHRARKMATGQYIAIWQGRPENQPK